MAKKTQQPDLPSPDSETETLDWIKLHARELMLGGLVVLAIGLGGVLYRKSAELKASNADDALQSAEQTVAAGNLELAEGDLQKMITRYDGTPAATQGSILLAQAYYQEQKYDQGIAALQHAEEKNQSGPFAAPVLQLIAAGYSQLGRPADAAAAYVKAAAASPYGAEQASLRSLAARAYAAAGNKAAAVAIWEDLVKNEDRTIASEARLRLGEFATEAAGKS
jgi:predicted negative regulator of RcsB-dependent stress response